jgi:hypothetical protein
VIIVLDPLDIILRFDQLQADLAGIFQPVLRAAPW